MEIENNMEKNDDSRAETIDYVVAVLLGIATILGTLSAYYSTLWGGNQAQSYVKGIMTMNQSSTNYLESLHDYNSLEMTDFKDDFLEVQWKEAIKNKDIEEAEYFESRMSEELEKIYKASDDSIESAAAKYGEAIELKEEDLMQRMDSAIILNESAKKMVVEGDKANEYGDKFTFVTVLYTIVLFFGGMAAVTRQFRLKVIYLIVSSLMFVYSTISMLAIPFP